MQKLIILSIFFLVLGLVNVSFSQVTEWTYESGSGNGALIKITEVNNKVSTIQMSRGKGNQWVKTDILSMNGKVDYIRVKSKSSQRIYELYVHWYEDKLVRVGPDSSKQVFWLKK